MRLSLILAVALSGWPAGHALAQAGLGTEIAEVYQQTKAAKNVDDYSAIVEQCEQLRGRTRDPERVKYLRSLLSWALNKRGEAFAEQAAAAEDPAAAQALDSQALEDFEAAVANDPTRWRAVHNRGVSMALAGEHEAAEQDFARTIELNPQYINAWFNRAEIRFETGQHAEALGDYNQVLQLAPQDLGALRGRGMCRLRMGEHRVAVADLTKALEAAEPPASGEIHVGRGLAHQALKDWARAAEDFRAAVAADNGSADAYRAAAWLMAACPDDQFRDDQLAVEAAHKAAELEQQRWGQVSVSTLDTLAAAYANQGDAEKAAQYAQQALDRRDLVDPAARQEIQQRLQLYQQGRPYRVASGAAPAAR